MSPLKYSYPLLPDKPSARHKTQSPISKITFMPMTPPNLSPDLTCQQFYSHTLYCRLGSSNSDVHQHLFFSQRCLISYIPCTPCHTPATSMVFLQLYPPLPTEMLTSLQSWTPMIPPPPQSFLINLLSIILLNSFCVRTYPGKYNHPILLCLSFFQAFLLSPAWPQRTHRV